MNIYFLKIIVNESIEHTLSNITNFLPLASHMFYFNTNFNTSKLKCDFISYLYFSEINGSNFYTWIFI